LAYADDTLVYIRDYNDFNILQNAVSIYMNASNAKLNYHKTTALSLSGLPNPTWQQFLVTHNIKNWHDRTSPTPLMYLGYPICASLTQRNTAFTNLYTSIKQSCFMHSQRQLSILGRATVLNSLILSKLWHILRVFNLTQEQISSLQNLGPTFINHHIYPRLSNNVTQLPRHQGGLGVLNIATQ
jgi:hypothetical protein